MARKTRLDDYASVIVDLRNNGKMSFRDIVDELSVKYGICVSYSVVYSTYYRELNRIKNHDRILYDMLPDDEDAVNEICKYIVDLRVNHKMTFQGVADMVRSVYGIDLSNCVVNRIFYQEASRLGVDDTKIKAIRKKEGRGTHGKNHILICYLSYFGYNCAEISREISKYSAKNKITKQGVHAYIKNSRKYIAEVSNKVCKDIRDKIELGLEYDKIRDSIYYDCEYNGRDKDVETVNVRYAIKEDKFYELYNGVRAAIGLLDNSDNN